MYYLKCAAQLDNNEPMEALATIATCAARARNPIRCLSVQNDIDVSQGNCPRLEQTSRKILLQDPTDNFPYLTLAEAAYASGQPAETVSELLKENVTRTPLRLQPRVNLEHLWAQEVLAGDFEGALTRLRELEVMLASESDQSPHALLALRQSELLLEQGQVAEAGRVAQAFLRRKDAWIPEPRRDGHAISHDPTVRLLRAARRAELLSDDEFEEQRRRWVERWTQQVTADNRAFVWLYAYAAVAETADDARTALANRPEGLPLRPYPTYDSYIGATLLRADRADDALPYLRRAAHACSALQFPLEHLQAQLMLGQALEATHQTKEACEAYSVVLTHWGSAKPRSVTAERARSLAKALGCATGVE
jgi:predicted Zn-dependent protease